MYRVNLIYSVILRKVWMIYSKIVLTLKSVVYPRHLIKKEISILSHIAKKVTGSSIFAKLLVAVREV